MSQTLKQRKRINTTRKIIDDMDKKLVLKKKL